MHDPHTREFRDYDRGYCTVVTTTEVLGHERHTVSIDTVFLSPRALLAVSCIGIHVRIR